MTLPGLQANTQYHYRVASVGDGETIASGDSTFQTAVAPGTPFRFVVYGDTRTQPQAHSQVVQGIAGSHPRFVIHTGDLVEDGPGVSAMADRVLRAGGGATEGHAPIPMPGQSRGELGMVLSPFLPAPGEGDTMASSGTPSTTATLTSP